MSTRSLAPRLARLAVAAMFLAVASRGLAESPRDASHPDLAANKQIMTRFLEEVWNGGHLELCRRSPEGAKRRPRDRSDRSGTNSAAWRRGGLRQGFWRVTMTSSTKNDPCH